MILKLAGCTGVIIQRTPTKRVGLSTTKQKKVKYVLQTDTYELDAGWLFGRHWDTYVQPQKKTQEGPYHIMQMSFILYHYHANVISEEYIF